MTSTPDATSEVQRVGSGGPWEQLYGYSRAVRAGDLIVSSGCRATVDGNVVHVGDPGGQTKIAFQIALDGIVAAGASVSDVIRHACTSPIRLTPTPWGESTVSCSVLYVRLQQWWSSPGCWSRSNWSRSRWRPTRHSDHDR